MSLLRTRRFLPLFLTQALGALNDNLFKNALVVLIAFRGLPNAPALVALAGGLFILPYLVVSATAGQVADRFDKARLIRMLKLAEIALAAAGAAALLSGHVAGLLLVLLGFGAQAAMFSPLKYGILPEQLADDELLRGNALIEAGTFVAILLGTILGGILIGLADGALVVGLGLLAVAAAGWACSLAIPARAPAAPDLAIDRNPAAATLSLLGAAKRNRPVWIAILGLSWFWALGATFLAQFPVLAQAEFHADNRVVTLLLASFSVGVGVGSLLVGRLARTRAARLVPAAGLALSASTAAFVALAATPAAAGWATPAAMLASPAGLAALLALLAASASGGAFSVPLYARLQTDAAPAERARTIAANNVLNAVFMVAGAVAIAALAAAGLRPGPILLLTAPLNAAVALWLRRAVARGPALGHESA